MARFLSLRLASVAAGGVGTLAALAGLSACTAILGDFEVTTTSGGADTGLDTTPTADGGEDAPGDVQPDAKPNGLSGVRAVAAGARHTCAIANLGEVFC